MAKMKIPAGRNRRFPHPGPPKGMTCGHARTWTRNTTWTSAAKSNSSASGRRGPARRPGAPVSTLRPATAKAAAERLGHGRGAVGCAELLEDVLEVRLHCVRRDEQLLRDVAVRVAEGEELEHLDLAGGEGLGLAIALLGLGQFLGERHYELRVDDHVAPRHQAHRLDEVLGVARLQHVAAGAR